MSRPLRVLIVEDLSADAELILLALRSGGFEPEWMRVETAEELKAALTKESWDAVLSDYTLPHFGAPAALDIVRAVDPDLPFIVISGTVGEEIAAAMMRIGANDYLIKQNLVRLPPALERELLTTAGRRARRDAEALWKQSEIRYRRLFEAAHDGILIVDAVSRQVVDANPYMTELLGYELDELLGKELWEIGLLGDIAANKAAFQSLQESGFIRYDEYPLRHQDGHQIDVKFVNNEYDVGGKKVIQCNIRDMTKQKRAAVTLRNSEERYRTLVDATSAMVWDSPASGEFDTDQPGWTAFTGQTVAQHRGWGWVDAVHPDDREKSAKAWAAAIQSHHPYQVEHRIRRADGVYREMTVRAVPIFNGEGKIREWVGVHTDVTDQKRAVEALRASQEGFRVFMEHTPAAVDIKDEKGRFLYVNSAWLRQFDPQPKDWLGKTNYDYWPRETADHFRVSDAKCLELNAGTQTEETAHMAGGQELTKLVMKFPLVEGGLRRIGGISWDITDRKRADEAMRASEERFRTFMDHSPTIAYIKDVEGRFLYVNETWRKQFDASPDDWLGKTNYDYWPRETADLFRQSDELCLASDAFVQSEIIAKSLSGKLLNWFVMKFPLYENGKRRIGAVVLDVTDQKRAENDLRMRDRAIQAATQGLMIADATQPDCPIIYASPACEKISGYHHREVLGRNARFFQGKETDPAVVAELRDAIREGKSCTVELLNYRKDGTTYWNELSIAPVRDEAGRLINFIGVQADVTARRNLQNQFHQAQKMEAFGQLAGGIAHDFNNLLTIINGYSEILLGASPEESAREMIAEILKAGQRSASLTRQLLVFSRQQVLMPKVFDLNESVRESEKMFRRVIGEDIELHTVSHRQLDSINADPGQIEQVLMNLVVNARDAMPQGGKLTIETGNIQLTEEDAREHPDIKPGNYVMLTVSDNGSGMTEETRSRLFEPFFTTKETGKGTGLGLAVVHSIVKQSDGHIEVESEAGLGTSFRIYLPRAAKSVVPGKSRIIPRTTPRGIETILLVEDEEALRVFTVRTLRLCGYVVIEAANGNEALRVAEKYDEPIHLLITDVVMPGMGGRKLADQLAPLHANMKVLYISGYTDDAVIRHGIAHEEVEFLQKPFSAIALAVKVREVLDASATNRA